MTDTANTRGHHPRCPGLLRPGACDCDLGGRIKWAIHADLRCDLAALRGWHL